MQTNERSSESDLLAYYIARFYRHLMTPEERAAHMHLTVAYSATYGMSPEEAERELASHPSVWISRDPAVLTLAAKGLDQFLADVRDRILREHPSDVFINRCPRCHALTRTPQAKWCPTCGHDWHHAPAA
jgi:hypothetical protein